jgi:putative ABC transport system substrate-binding protein
VKNKILFISLAVVLALSVGLIGCTEEAPEEEETVIRIGECVIIEHPDLESDQQGFHEIVDAWAELNGVTVEYGYKNAEGDMSLAQTIADLFVDLEVDLIHSITTPISQACVGAAEGTDIPIVFSTVTAPAKAGIVSTWDAPRPDNVCGVSDMADMPAQMEIIKEIMPELSVLGVIYNAGEMNSVVQIEHLTACMADVGIDELVEATCGTTAEVGPAAASLVGRCDAIYIPTDNTAVSGLEAIIAVAEENKIPFFGSTGDMVDRGCISAKGADYYWIGQEAGRYAVRVLEGEFPGDIPVVACAAEACPVVVNLGAAERMGITIPQSVIDKADRVVE